MKRIIYTILAVIISTIICDKYGLTAYLAPKCISNISEYSQPLVENKDNRLPIIITADNVEGNYPKDVIFTGNVNINQGNVRLHANEVQLFQKPLKDNAESMCTIFALGDVHYEDSQIILKGQKAWSNLNTKDIDIWKGNYHMLDRQGYGKADLIKQRGENRYTILENGSFTSCLPNFNAWNIIGSKVIYDRTEQIIEIWNAQFKLGSLPILYSPYLKLPVGNKRRSGFLIPHAKYSITNYFNLHVPYYWNIAPNVDATITTNYIHKRGNIMWENELCYLTKAGVGIMEFYYLPLDKIFKSEHPTKRNYHRWLYHWQHSNTMEQRWHFNANYTKISDPYYFNNFSSKYGSSTDNYATQTFSVDYVTQNFDATISMHRFQIFSGKADSAYSAEPQLDINWYKKNDIIPFNIRIYGQAVNFVNTNPNMPIATRVHFEPIINIPWSNDWANVDTKVKMMITHYQQRNLEYYNAVNNLHLKESINRMLPQFNIEGRFIFKRDINLVNIYTQTLEPRVQYLYIPYHNHSKINNYDSSALRFDYSSLFNDRTYGGLDFITPANQVTTGVTSRVFDNNAIECFNISVGEIYRLTTLRTDNDSITLGRDNRNKIYSLVWAGNAYWRINDHWSLRGDIQYNTHLNNFTTGSASAEYCHDEDHMAQFTYRYANQEYVKSMLSNSDIVKQYDQGISQMGGVISWRITNHWLLTGTYYLDTNTHKVADKKLGIQYSSCCYAIQVGYEHKINGWNSNINQSEYDNIIGFNIELRGLSSNCNLSSQQILRSNILPYSSLL